MALLGEEERLESDLEPEDEGGPVKPFLEHLEDLRWVLIKCVVAVALGMLLCLIGANYVLEVLKWPLVKADRLRVTKTHEVAFYVGTNLWVKVKPGSTNFGPLIFSNDAVTAFELVPVPIGSNYVLALQPVTNAAVLAHANTHRTVLINLSPVGGFWVAFQVAMYGGFVLAAPYLIFVLGQFIIPALRIREKTYATKGFAIGTLLFLLGVAFCYFLLMPLALRASYGYSEWLGFSADQWRAEDYVSFVCKFMLGMGIGFEMPVVLLLLVKIGVFTYARLKGMRRYMIVINLVLGAVLTTPEVVTQVLMFIPLQFMYELSVWIAGYWEKDQKERRRAKIQLGIVILLLGLLCTAAYMYRADITRMMHSIVSHQ